MTPPLKIDFKASIPANIVSPLHADMILNYPMIASGDRFLCSQLACRSVCHFKFVGAQMPSFCHAHSFRSIPTRGFNYE
jgi:hypothetical protein